MELSNFSSIFEIATGFNIGIAKSKDFREFIGLEKRFSERVENNLKEIETLFDYIKDSRLYNFQQVAEGVDKQLINAKNLKAEYKGKFEKSAVSNSLYFLHIFFGLFSFSILILCGIIDDFKHDSSLLLLNIGSILLILYWVFIKKKWYLNNVQEKSPIFEVYVKEPISSVYILLFFLFFFLITLIAPTSCIKNYMSFSCFWNKDGKNVNQVVLYIMSIVIAFTPSILHLLYITSFQYKLYCFRQANKDLIGNAKFYSEMGTKSILLREEEQIDLDNHEMENPFSNFDITG